MAKQPTEEVLQQRRDILRARGVPEGFIEDIATRNDISRNPWRDKGGAILYLLIGMPVFAALIFASDAIVKWAVEWAGLRNGAILFHYDDVFMAPAFMLLMVAFFYFLEPAALLIGGRVRPHPAAHLMVSGLRELFEDEAKGEPVRPLPPEKITGRTEKEFLAGFYRDDLRRFKRNIFIVLTAFIVLFIAGQGNYWRLTKDHFAVYSFWMRHDYAIKDVQYVSVGCNIADKRAGVARYEIHFKDKTIAIGGALLDASDRLSFKKAEAFDARLHQMKIPYREWQGDWIVYPATGKDAEFCYRQLGKRLSQNGYERVKALLTLP